MEKGYSLKSLMAASRVEIFRRARGHGDCMRIAICVLGRVRLEE